MAEGGDIGAEGGNVGGEGGNQAGQTYTQDDLDALVEQRLADERDAILRNRDTALAEAKRAKAALSKFEGIDPDEYRELKAAAEKAEQDRLAAEGDFKSLEKQLIDRHNTELEAKEQRIATVMSALEKRLIDADAAQAIAAEKGSVRGLLPHVRPHIRVVEQEGEFVARVVDSNGNPRIEDGNGTPMSIAALVQELKQDQDLARLFDGTGSSGGGASKSAAGGGGAKQTIAAGDSGAFLANLEKIARGEAEVVGL